MGKAGDFRQKIQVTSGQQTTDGETITQKGAMTMAAGLNGGRQAEFAERLRKLGDEYARKLAELENWYANARGKILDEQLSSGTYVAEEEDGIWGVNLRKPGDSNIR